RVGVPVCDISAGMTAFQGVLQALFARERNGKGRHIAVSLYNSMADWMNVPYLQFVYGGKAPPRCGLAHPTIAPYGAFACRDGKLILISIQNDREWVGFCKTVLGKPEAGTDMRFETNVKRVANRPALEAIICEVFAQFDREEMAAKLEASRIAYGRVSTMEDVAKHPQNRFVDIESPYGTIRMMAPGTVVDGKIAELGRVPSLGEHTHKILAEFS